MTGLDEQFFDPRQAFLGLNRNIALSATDLPSEIDGPVVLHDPAAAFGGMKTHNH